MYIETEKKLRELYGFPKGRSKDKQLDRLEVHTKRFISLSPFVLISTCSKQGDLVCSPRGGNAGFVVPVNDHCLLIPDSKGNNRLDSFVNIVNTGKVGCLFLIPGVDETLRVNGEAKISTSPEYLNRYTEWSNPPRACIVVSINEVFLHCAKALMRSGLWDQNNKIDRKVLPTMGKMLNDQLSISEEPETQEQMIERYKRDL